MPCRLHKDSRVGAFKLDLLCMKFMASTVTEGKDNPELAVHKLLGLLRSPEFQVSILNNVRHQRSKGEPTVDPTREAQTRR